MTKKDIVQDRFNEIVDYLVFNPQGYELCNIKVAKLLLLKEKIISQGRVRNIKSQHKGAGIYKITLEELK